MSEAERIAAAVVGVDGVVSMSAGALGQFRSYLPGGSTVPGVRIDPEHLDVNVVTRYEPLPELVRAIGAALEPILRGRSLTVGIDDVLLPGDAPPDAPDSLVEAKPAPDCAWGDTSDQQAPTTDGDHDDR